MTSVATADSASSPSLTSHFLREELRKMTPLARGQLLSVGQIYLYANPLRVNL